MIREETPGDAAAIRLVNERAFGQPDEADLVDALRCGGGALLSLVAELDSRVVGHVLFSRMTIESGTGSTAAVALAPMAVLPDYQRRGIGGMLIRHGIEQLRAQGERIVIVVGHPGYYPRFGFSSERARTLMSPFPLEAFMALELEAGALDGVSGRVKYADPFGVGF